MVCSIADSCLPCEGGGLMAQCSNCIFGAGKVALILNVMLAFVLSLLWWVSLCVTQAGGQFWPGSPERDCSWAGVWCPLLCSLTPLAVSAGCPCSLWTCQWAGGLRLDLRVAPLVGVLTKQLLANVLDITAHALGQGMDFLRSLQCLQLSRFTFSYWAYGMLFFQLRCL